MVKARVIKVWCAEGPNGEIIPSSIGASKAAAKRWALKYSRETRKFRVALLITVHPRWFLTERSPQ